MTEVLKENENQLFQALSNSSDSAFFFASDLKQDAVVWSKSAQAFLGLKSAKTKNIRDFWENRIYPEDREKFNAYFENIFHSTVKRHDLEYRIETATGNYEWILCSSSVDYDKNGQPARAAGFIRPLGYRNKIDPISNLRTIHEFRRNLRERLQKNDRGAVLMFDLLNFKKIIDDHGYAFGDKFFYTMGVLLKKELHKDDSLFRMQGSHFAVIIKSCKKTDIHAAFEAIQKVLRNIRVENIDFDQDFVCAATIFPSDGVNVDRLQQNLYYAIDHAKTLHAKELVYYTEELYIQKLRQSKIREAIKKSLQNDCCGFELYFQPIVATNETKCKSAEALLRFSTPELGSVSPAEFIPLLEMTGDIIHVGAWVIDKAMQHLAEWKSLHSGFEQIHVNVSSIQFLDSRFKETVSSVLRKYAIPASSLVLELTESCRIQATEEFAELFKELREMGVKTALDDFGTGYASLIILCDIPIDILKIDFKLTQNFVKYPQHRSILKLVSDFCKKGTIRLCAEGVETQDSLTVMKNAGTDLIQGYLISRPIPAAEFKEKYIKPFAP